VQSPNSTVRSQKKHESPVKLPRTGIEQPFLATNLHFVRRQKEVEVIADTQNTLKPLIDDYKLRENMKQNHAKMPPKVVYDCLDASPYYDKGEVYLDAKEAILVQPPAGHPNFLQTASKKDATPLNRFFKELNPYYKLKDEGDETLVFESRFESGNLRRSIQVDKYEYDLVLKTDFKTNNHTQWYFFRVKNAKKFRQYQFNLLNFVKPDSSYNSGMKPLMYSRKEAESTGIGWHRCGEDIAYYQSNAAKSKCINLGGNQSISAPTPSTFYTLSFRTSFKH